MPAARVTGGGLLGSEWRLPVGARVEAAGLRIVPKGPARTATRKSLRNCWIYSPNARSLMDMEAHRADYNPSFTFRMAKTTPPAATTPLPDSYEDALAELERLVVAMEGGQLPLDRLLESYKRGADLLNFCRGRLDAVEQQVKVLEEGQLKPWTTA